jgi:uncharacterized protein YqeY
VSLQERIQSDLTAAMKARDRQQVGALRMLVAAMRNAAVEAGRGPQGRLPDEVVERLVAKEIKSRREAAAAYREAGRDDRAAAEEADVEVYARYLPEQLDDDELVAIVEDAIARVGADGPAQMGQVMKEVMPRVGNRAGGARVSALVKSRLLD